MRFKDLKDTFYVVQATSHEMFTIWLEWNQAIPIEQDTLGLFREIGKCGDMLVTVMFFRYKIWDKWVVFYEPTSQVVDHRLIEAWIKENILVHTSGWDKGHRTSHCVAQNFHLCVEALEEATGKKRRDIWSDEARLEIVAAELTQLIERVGRKSSRYDKSFGG